MLMYKTAVNGLLAVALHIKNSRYQEKVILLSNTLTLRECHAVYNISFFWYLLFFYVKCRR